ncbi:MAG: hypothetical protein B6245_20060 [Desulfobacteraceae bacterium 4572_88]|nr:MAG: hypothetical protein B6245_20060 [Desulfobacteraceae bacterium 4572_88]
MTSSSYKYPPDACFVKPEPGLILTREPVNEEIIIIFISKHPVCHRFWPDPAQAQLTVSNAICREIIPRMLTETIQDVLPLQSQRFVLPDGRLDTDKLLAEFFREHSEHWGERFDYKEAGSQMLLQAFLQRIVNSGGRIVLGRKRTDLLILCGMIRGIRNW